MSDEKMGAWLAGAMRRHGYDPAARSGGRTELARAAGVSLPTISRMLDQPGYIPGIDALRRVANALGYPLGEALVASGLADLAELPVKPRDERTAAEILDDAEAQASELDRRLARMKADPDTRRRLEAIIDLLEGQAS
jgi:transcriptional regulator with XRE-family HTH domain